MLVRFESDCTSEGMVVYGNLLKSRIEQPLNNILSSIATRNTCGLAHAEINLPSRETKVFDYLATGLPATHYQNRSFGELFRIQIVTAMKLHYFVGKLASPGRIPGVLVSTRRDNHVSGLNISLGSFDSISTVTA